MADVILFGGTTEGRELAVLLRKKNIPALVCVATEYGESLLDTGDSAAVRSGRLDQAGMIMLIRAEAPCCVIDATHPYAAEAGQNIRVACEKTGVRYIRVLRESAGDTDCIEFADMEALTIWLNHTNGTVFSSLGAKEAAQLTAVMDYRERVWLRILPLPDGLSACLNAGFPASHIICMQGPFSQELNAAMFRATGASILLTKESGVAGGFPEKLTAARKCGMTVAVLARPCIEDGLKLGELMQRIEEGTL